MFHIFLLYKHNFFVTLYPEHKRLGGLEASSNGAWLTSKFPTAWSEGDRIKAVFQFQYVTLCPLE